MHLLKVLILAATATVAFADEKDALEAFAKARQDPVSDAGRGRMAQATERLAKEGGAASVPVLGEFIFDSDVAGAKLLDELREIKKRGALAVVAVDKYGRQLEQLHFSKQSGTAGLEPEIEACEAKLRRANDVFEGVKAKASSVGKLYEQHQAARAACASACVQVLGRVPAKQVAAAADSLRAKLDVASEPQSLLLVWILRQAKRVEASSALLEVYSHPKSSAPVRVEAACAVAALGDPDSI
ncbi:MAG: hypothetical protein ACYS0F_05785, partial [Planctomycetota bacterium]